jgi:hypothetical protein
VYPIWLLLLVAALLSVCGLAIGGGAGAFVVGLTVGVIGTMIYFRKEISDASK